MEPVRISESMSSEPVSFRLATVSDIDAIFDIWIGPTSEYFGLDSRDYFRLKEQFIGWFTMRESVFNYWVAEDHEQKIVAWNSFSRISQHPIKRNHRAEFSTYVHKDHRGNGVGSRLLAHCIEQARNNPELELIYGHVSASYSRMIHMLEKLGFEKVGVIPKTSKRLGDYDRLLYVYRLD